MTAYLLGCEPHPASHLAAVACGLVVFQGVRVIAGRFSRWVRPRLRYRRGETPNPLPCFRRVPDSFFETPGPAVRLNGDTWSAMVNGLEYVSADKTEIESRLDYFENERRGGGVC